MKKFKDRWMVATPEVQERVKKSILNYCIGMEKYSANLRKQLGVDKTTKISLREDTIC